MDINLYVGFTHFHIAHDGIWYQEGFPHKIKSTSPSAELSLSHKLEGSNWEYSVGILYLGKFESTAEAVADAEYNQTTKKCEPKPITNCALVIYNGSGTTSGITLAARRNYGNWFYEAGLIFEHTTWQVDIPNMQFYLGDDYPRWHYHVEHKTKIQILPTLAVGYSWEKFALRAGLYPTIGHGDEYQPIVRGISPNISVGYKF